MAQNVPDEPIQSAGTGIHGAHSAKPRAAAPGKGNRFSLRHRADKKHSEKPRGFGGWLREVATIIVIALLLSFLIKTFLFRAFYIPSGSMEETLEINDRIFVNLLVPEPFDLNRGDVVVFKDTKGWLPELPPASEGPGTWIRDALTFVGLVPDTSEQHLVKRVIGTEGDRVVCCDADGKITVNGEPLNEPYIYPGASPSDVAFDVVVPEGKVWVMGDHRNASADSREHLQDPSGGFIDVEDIEGKAAVTAWPLNRAGFVGSYPEVFENVPEPSTSLPAESK
ncbi:signal peptidase I [Arthrobacter citreus]|jgi:signal peptidase I|uniref:Signal peptidase I n=1 Tax=Arthrobacter citreus TaxID=1670 RepID=A0ABZ2ZYI1_9MICC